MKCAHCGGWIGGIIAFYGLCGCMGDQFDAGLVAEVDHLGQDVHHAGGPGTYDEGLAVAIQQGADVPQGQLVTLPPKPICVDALGVTDDVVRIGLAIDDYFAEMVSIDMHTAFSILVFPLRVINFLFAVWWYWMERGADAIVYFFVKTEYVRKGRCNQCGRCCQLLAMEMPARVSRRDWLVWLVSKWHSAVLNFELQGRDARWLVYSCRYYREKNGKMGCSIYPFRHRLCRFYPAEKLYGHPKLHPNCGFRFERRDGKLSFDEVLREKRKSDTPVPRR